MSNDQRHPNPRVIIVGAGICGLMMSLLLDKAGITHHVFERSSFIQARGRGSILSVSGNILPVFEQLNLLDKLYKISLRNSWTNLYNSKLKHIGKVGVENHLELTGYDFLIISRSQLYDILFAHIPKDRISFNKRVLSMRKCVSGTRIHCSDNSIYESDIVIGADGAYSAVRHNMHRMMKADGELSVRDTKEMAIPFMCLVGTTGHMDPERYPQLKDPLNHLHHVIGSTGYSWTVITIPEDRFCWSVMVQVKDQAEAKEQRFRNSEWFPKAYDDLTAQVKDFPITFGGTLGDLIAETTEDRISKFMLEEKLFERWHYNNIVLIGDACHKVPPPLVDCMQLIRFTSLPQDCKSSILGSMSAMQDAVILANCLYDLKDLSPESITAAFEDYRNQRFNEAKKQVVISKLSSQICNGQSSQIRSKLDIFAELQLTGLRSRSCRK
ncbi:hypothetical protein FBU30_009962 [Linnemannia zychae]|nr:hypothetical protein FBU30_009962 [Linnemannia zychae]